MDRGRAFSLTFVAILSCTSSFGQEAANEASGENLFVINNGAGEPDPTSESDVQDVEPLQMPVLPDQDVQDLLDQPAPVTDEAEITIDPIQPDERTELSYGNVQRADVSTDPYRRAGKLIMTFGGNQSSCTAENVGATDVIMTAAHCVYNRANQAFADDLSYRLAYANGGGEVIDWQCIGIKRGWQGADPYPWDFAFVKLAKHSSAGALGLRTGLGQSEWISIGYPGNFENAAYMQTVRGRKGTVGGGIAQMRDNPMTFGASGGVWADGLHAIGLNSFLRGDPNASNSLYGPVFNSQVADLFNFVNGGCQ